MTKIQRKFFHGRNGTLLKYLFSYVVILSILLVGFFGAVRVQIKNIYFHQLDKQTQERLQLIREQLRSDINSIDQIHTHLIADIDLNLSRYKKDAWNHYMAARRINEYSISNSFISDIIYIDRLNNNILSSGKYVYSKEDRYYLNIDQEIVELPVGQYGHTGLNRFVYLNQSNVEQLLYFPSVDSRKFDLFYTINMKEIRNMLKTAMSDGIISICLSDSENHIIAGVSPDQIMAYLDVLPDTENGRTETSQETVYSIPVLSDLRIAALFSKEVLLGYVDTAFRDIYLILLIVGSVGILLIAWAMKLTYWPLHKLTQKVVDHSAPDGDYVEQINQAFHFALTENQMLQGKVENYRLAMQKSILDSIVTDNDAQVKVEDIDQLFNMEPGSFIYAVKIAGENAAPSIQTCQTFLDVNLPRENSCITLEKAPNYVVFLVYYGGHEQDKDEVLRLLFHDLHEQTGYYIALSNSSSSPLEISSLYENAFLASSYWEEFPVVAFGDIEHSAAAEQGYFYPYRKLDYLTQLLQEQRFDQAREQVGELLNSIDEKQLPAFFIRCTLIDILTMFVNIMNRQNVKFKAYSDLYFAALYFCRSFSYEEKKEEIRENIYRMIDIFEAEICNTAIPVEQIRTIVLQNYTSPEFSISVLSDFFHVSIAYMSYLFKKKFNQNFIDYLWELRLEKAKELLAATDTPIDSISTAVGYLNTSSFRRKFKQAMGITPSQYRSRAREEHF